MTDRQPKRRPALFALLMAGCTLATACAGSSQHAITDRATYQGLAPLTTRYVMSDPAMDESAKQTHLRGLAAWDARIRAEEEAAGLALPAPAVAK